MPAALAIIVIYTLIFIGVTVYRLVRATLRLMGQVAVAFAGWAMLIAKTVADRRAAGSLLREREQGDDDDTRSVGGSM